MAADVAQQEQSNIKCHASAFNKQLKQSSVNVIDNYIQTHCRRSINEQSKLTTIFKHIVDNPLINN